MAHNFLGEALRQVRSEAAAARAEAAGADATGAAGPAERDEGSSNVYENLGSKVEKVASQINKITNEWLALRINGAEHENDVPTDRPFDAYPVPFYMISNMKGKWEDWFTFIAGKVDVNDPGICIFISTHGPHWHNNEYDGDDIGITKFGSKLTKATTKKVKYYAINSDDRKKDDDGNIIRGVEVSFLTDKMTDWIRQYGADYVEGRVPQVPEQREVQNMFVLPASAAAADADAANGSGESKSGGGRKKKRRRTRKKKKTKKRRRRKRKTRRKKTSKRRKRKTKKRR